MAEKMKNTNVPPQRGIGFFRQLIEQVRLSWALLLDNRVPLVVKLIPLGAIAYIVSPIDLVPDIFLGLGQLDDLGILMAALTTFNSLAPATWSRSIWPESALAMSTISSVTKQARSSTSSPSGRKNSLEGAPA